MVSLLPAILVGGPPHAGKSVLTYNLTRVLRQKNIPHYVFRANPDGEGDWFLESQHETVRQLYLRGNWSDDFIRLVSRDLKHRHLPLLVDLGGLPIEKEQGIFRACTHSLLLLRADQPDTARTWRRLVATHGLLPLADLYSQLSGPEDIESKEPVITGTLTGLIRPLDTEETRLTQPATLQGPLFKLLVRSICQLFGSYTQDELIQTHLDTAPTEFVVNLPHLLQVLEPGSTDWTPALLPALHTELPTNTPLAVYGRAANWVYAMLTVQTGKQPFYQFDARLGWISPPVLHTADHHQSTHINIELTEQSNFYVLSMHCINDYLDYTQVQDLALPPLPTDQGIVVSGKIPLWLLTAVVRTYRVAGSPWIACYQPQLSGAIVIASYTREYRIGQIIR